MTRYYIEIFIVAVISCLSGLIMGDIVRPQQEPIHQECLGATK